MECDDYLMGPGSYGLMIAFFVCLVLSGFFSASETAFSTANRIRLKNLAQNGNKRAARVLNIVDDYDSMISAVLIGNNIVNIASASIATVLFVNAYGDIGATLSTLFTTIIVLIFGEITPKSIAKATPEKFAMFASGTLRVLIIIFCPIIAVLSVWKNWIKKIFKLDSKTNITEGEFLTMVDEAENDGGIGKEDSDLIKSVIEFNDLDASEIFTPRVDVVAVSVSDSIKDIEKAFVDNEFSRLPVYEDDIDDIIGFIHQRDFYTYVTTGIKKIKDIVNPVMYVAPNMKISKILTELQLKHEHMAVVTDEFGGTDGILTMEDILEELVGEIYDEHDEEVKEFEKISDNEYKILCNTDLDDLFDFFKLPECDSDSNSVGGWILEQFEKIPAEGDTFDYENLHVTVTKTDSRRVLEITVRVEPNNEESDDKGE